MFYACKHKLCVNHERLPGSVMYVYIWLNTTKYDSQIRLTNQFMDSQKSALHLWCSRTLNSGTEFTLLQCSPSLVSLLSWCRLLPSVNEVWGKVISLQASVCPQGGGTWPGTPPQDQVHPPQEQTPPWGPDTPGTRYTPRDQTAPRRPGTPLGSGTPPEQKPPTRHPPGTRYTPRRACWETRSTRGRSASYWNAILFHLAKDSF